MKQHPILFSPPMVRAILEDRKRQTRTVVTSYNSRVGEGSVDWALFDWKGESVYRACGIPHHKTLHQAPLPWRDGTATTEYLHVPYNWPEDGTIYRIHPRYEVGDHLWVKENAKMLRRDSRITLVVTGIRVQQVQDISDADIVAEGLANPGTRGQFAALWEDINGAKHPWASNPWVWIREFERLP